MHLKGGIYFRITCVTIAALCSGCLASRDDLKFTKSGLEICQRNCKHNAQCIRNCNQWYDPTEMQKGLTGSGEKITGQGAGQ